MTVVVKPAGKMSSQPPGQLKGDGSSKKPLIDSDDPTNYTGSCGLLYDYKMKAKAIYQTDTCQLIVAGVIFLNFIVVMFSVTQYVLDNAKAEAVCDDLDTIFISFFMVELFLNLFTSAQGIDWVKDDDDKDDMQPRPEIISIFFWQWEFWIGENWGWNWFDFIVIMVPVVMAGFEFASSIRILRLFRVIRVLKSIAKFEALQVVASSVSRSMSGVGATAIFILITLCMYSIIAVEMFGKTATEDSPDGPNGAMAYSGRTYQSMSWQEKSVYANENCEGVPLWKYFGNIRRSMLTMFVFTTVEGWPDLGWCLGKTYALGSAYCTSFIIITALLMANIVVAIFTNKMEEAQEEVEAEAKKKQAKRQASIARAFSTDKSTVQGIDLDGDGIADEFIIDADGDGVADIKMTAEEMAQIWTVGEPIEVYSHTIMQWCPGQVKEVSHSDQRIKVEYDVDGNTLGEKTIPFKHDSIRRPAGAAIGGKNVKVMATSTMNTDSLGGVKIDGFSFQGVGGGQNNGDLANVLKSFQAKLDSIGQKVDTLMSDKSQKGRI